MDHQSLRNWLILAMIYNVIVVLGLMTAWDMDVRTQIVVWFLCQPIFWGAWFVLRKREGTENNRSDSVP